MNHFSINDIENLTGIKAHTLRIWEQRYDLCPAKRKESGHRYYDDEDLKQMLRVALLYKNGHKISRLACLEDSEILNLAIGIEAIHQYDSYVIRLLEATQAFNQERFDQVFDLLIEHLGFEKTMQEIIYPFLEKIGMLWLTDRAVPAQEHFSSNLIVKKIITAIDQLEKTTVSNNRLILLFTPVGEAHEIPLLYMEYLFKKYGTKTIYMGREVSFESLQEMAAHKKPTHFYFHLITHLASGDPVNYLEQLASIFPSIKIAVSGNCITERIKQVHGEIIWLRSGQQISAFVKQT
jgi:DNA-binding transcriptional MerR regulator